MALAAPATSAPEILSFRPRVNDERFFARPCSLITGASGSGKTRTIGSLLRAGLRVGLADIEGKSDIILKERPAVFTVPTRAHVGALLAIMRDTKQRRALVARTTDGEWEDIDILAVDGLLEYESLLDSDLKVEFPRGSSEKDGWARWDEYGTKILNFTRLLRDLATFKTPDPIGVMVTLGTPQEVTKLGQIRDVIPIKGNIAPQRFPFMFTFILHLRSMAQAGQAKFVLDTVGNELWMAKGPGPSVLPATIDITEPGGEMTFADAYRRMDGWLRGEIKAA